MLDPAIIRERLREPIRNIIRVTNLYKLDVFSIDGFAQDFRTTMDPDRALDFWFKCKTMLHPTKVFKFNRSSVMVSNVE